MGLLENNAITLLQKGMEATWEKQRVINTNIANKSTPGYKAQYLDFEEELKRKISQMKAAPGGLNSASFQQGINSVKVNVKQTTSESTKLDGNNVDIEAENIELARVQLQYEVLVRQITDQFSRLRTVIDGR